MEVKDKVHRKPKIISFSHYSELYGANRSLLTLLTATENEIDWWVICRSYGNFTEELKKRGIKFSVVSFKTDVYNDPPKFLAFSGLCKLLYNIFLAIYIAFIVIRNRINFIHSNSSVIFIGSLVALMSGRKHLWHIREFVYEDYNSKYNLGKYSFKFFAKRSSHIICISKSIKQVRIIDQSIFTPTTILYNGLFDEKAKIAPRKRPNDTPILSIVGVINPAKNQLVAVKALTILIRKGIEINLRIIGDINSPEYYNVLKEYIEKESISKSVQFMGFVNDVSIPFQDTDISLMCSHKEALGRVTIESMIFGVPVVAFGSAGTMEIIEDGKTGLLYYGNEKTLAEKLELLLIDKLLYSSISNNAFEHVSKTFTIKSYASGFLNIVNKYDES